MIIWGRGGDNKDLGQVGTRQCPICQTERPFKLFLQYRFAHLYYIFGWVTQKKYMIVCDVCRRGRELAAKEVEGKLEKNPIPFMKRYGWTFLVGFIALAALSAAAWRA
jgi:hypothetical protein